MVANITKIKGEYTIIQTSAEPMLFGESEVLGFPLVVALELQEQ